MNNDLRVIKTKAALMQALVELLKIKMLDKISVTELCKLAKVNRGTFYLHYEDISSLFEDYFYEITLDLQKAYYEPYTLTNNRIENVEAEMVRIFHHVLTYKEFYKIVFDEKTPTLYYFRLYEMLKKYLYESIDNSVDTYSAYMASYQANAIIGLVIQWIHNDFVETPSELNNILIKLMRR